MNRTLESQVNSLAYHLWLSAGRECRRVVDFWIMAEQMVWELAVATSRMSGSAIEASSMIERTAPAIAATCLQRIQELAYFMWEASGAQCGRAMEFWLAAERHVMTMMIVSGHRANVSDAGEDAEQDSEGAAGLPFPVSPWQFSADAYLNEIRRSAYYMWERAGREPSGDPLGFWLAAERQVLHRIESEAMMPSCAATGQDTRLLSSQPDIHSAEPAHQPDEQEPLSPPRYCEDGSRTISETSPLRIRRREAPQTAHVH